MQVGGVSGHIVAFGRALRRAGMRVGTGQVLDAVRAVECVGLRRREDVRQALFSVLVVHAEDREFFDELFEAMWSGASLSGVETPPLPPSRLRTPPESRRRAREALSETGRPRPGDEQPAVDVEEPVATYSAIERLRRKDFAEFTAEEVAAAKALMRRMRWWPLHPTRRRKRGRGGHALDVRRTVRAGLRRHGELLRLYERRRKEKTRPVVVLCDVSGSMERYARMLLHFVHAVSGELPRVEAFVFGTRLTRITRQLRHRDVDAALAAVAAEVLDWSGGTRIGEAIHAFNYRWLRRVLRSSGVVLIISDGWDRGDPELLGREMARLSLSCHRLVWLNPLMGYAGYEPLTRGMQAALPHVDDLLPVHNLEALDQLGGYLGALAERRRRPGPRNVLAVSV